ncbi:hypothetical protein evm_011312 [Chilo suppressalis]|nr:hypothetical protein evm_011312 [Chilo suppressalis]
MADGDLMDSQLLSESVGFLENCFDNSFSVLQTTLKTIKEYLSAEKHSQLPVNKSVAFRNVDEAIYKVPVKEKCKSIHNLTELVNKNLKDWGLPHDIVNKYEERGINEMFDWQVTCLSNPKVLIDCSNLVFSAPTSAGKTLVAEIITIKTIIERQKKVIIILPFVSIVREKMFYLQDILSGAGIRVEGFMGSQSPPGGLQAVHVAICTIEKANSLVNRLLDEGSISELGAVIVDELHLLGDPHRGYILELLLTKIKYVSVKFADTQIQVVGMSATLPNLNLLANWLNAELFVTQFRPIPLDEYCLVGNKFYNKNGEYLNIMHENSSNGESDSVLKLCLDTIKENCSVLIFCMTKNRCENLAQSLSSSFFKIGCSGSEMGLILRNQLKTDNIVEVLEQLKNSPVGLDQVLKSTISFGVAYHHAGLTFDERDIIEGGFKSGAIRVLVATSTLSSGVNLPARKVIIRTPVFQRQPINILTYKQMIGRAGRMGKDTKGESILICTEAEKKIGFDLMMGALAPVKSCIESEDKFMRAVLEMIASQIVCSQSELELYSQCTLLYAENETLKTDNSLLKKTLKELINYELVRMQNEDENIQYIATPLGKACLSSSMAPNDGLSLFCELQKARQCLVLENDLHLIYLVTPYSVSNQWGEIDWLHLLTLWESLTKGMKKVGELVGVQESFIICSLRGSNKFDNSQQKLNIHKRFYTALALQDLVNEMCLSEVAAKFQCARGFLQSLQQAAATFAGMVTAFCNQLGWKNMGMLVSQFQDRLHFGIQSDLIELMKLPSLNGVRARSLFDCGFETVASIASGDVHRLENALHKSLPFQSEKVNEGDDIEDIRKRNKIKNVWITGCCAMTAKEAAEKLKVEARKYLEYEIGVTNIKWDKNNSSVVQSQSISTVNVSDVKNEAVKNSIELTFAQLNSENGESELEKNKEESLSSLNVFLSADPQKDDICNLSTNTLNVYKFGTNKVLVNSSDNKHDIKKKHVEGEAIENIISISDHLNNHANVASPLKDITNLSKNLKVTKEEIIWDSLNFTEIPNEGITKVRGSDNTMFSPNRTLDSVEDKLECNEGIEKVLTFKSSSKDVSLFSSDGENSSLFEDSLPLDLLPSKLLDNIDDNMNNQTLKQSGGSNQLNSVINQFISKTNEIDDDEDIKLVYEEDNKDSDKKHETYTKLRKTNDEITTQDEKIMSVKDCFVSPCKRHLNVCSNNILMQPPKKVKKSVTSNNNTKLTKEIILKKATSKQYILKIHNSKIHCYILTKEDILDNMHVFDHVDNMSVYLDIKNSMSLSTCNTIGSNILRSTKTIKIHSENEFSNTVNIKSISISFKPYVSIVLDLSNLDHKNMTLVKSMLSALFKRKDIKWKYFSLQPVFVQLKRFLNTAIPLPWVDVSLFEWLVDSDEKPRYLSHLAKKYCDIDLATISVSVDNKEKQFKNLESFEELSLRSWFIWHIAERLYNTLLKQYTTVKNIIDTEIKVLKILAGCECSGVTVDKQLASRLLIDVKKSQEILQKKAFKICGYHFNFNSSKDVAKVLGMYKGRKVSTKKSVLTAHNTPLSSIIIYWRKLNSILTKTLYPLTEKACIYSEGDRINPSYTMYTCTGRVSMHEPNLQNVPRPFCIPMKYLTMNKEESIQVVEFNCRSVFQAAAGHVLISADYCQLEMRILTHYSEDPVLTDIMNSNVDVFKSIAVSWSGVTEDEVDDDLRQKAKQLCYGILYGMGNKTLAQHLDVTELEAAMFMDSFYKTYPAVKAFTQAVIEDCRLKGYVETLTKRRRYLPDINSSAPSKRAAAERQAVNTTIQGSAADIAKAAMCAIDSRTDQHRHKPELYLQMHDELIYEVHESYKSTFIEILKEAMEGTVRLKVPLPVKVKIGTTWGDLNEIKL